MDRLLNGERSGPNGGEWRQMHRVFRRYVDRTVPHLVERWIVFGLLLALFLLRVFFVGGYYIVTYGLGIYFIGQLMAFLTPQADPDGNPTLPTRESDEFKPFIRKLPEFKFWYALTKALLVAMVMSVIPIFNIPAYWPVLVMYFIVLLAVTLRTQVKHMIKYKYVPFSFGKKRYGKKVAK